MTFGPAGEVLSTTGAGEDVYWAQGAQGQQAMKSDGNGNTSTFFTDSAGVTQHWLRPDGRITAQNGGGQVTETTDADNQVVAHAYDDDDVQHDYTGTHAYLGSPFGVNSPRNSAVTYNPAGWTSSVGNGVGGAAVNGFDPQGAPTSVTTTIANGNNPAIVWTVTPSCYDNGAVHVLTTPPGRIPMNMTAWAACTRSSRRICVRRGTTTRPPASKAETGQVSPGSDRTHHAPRRARTTGLTIHT